MINFVGSACSGVLKKITDIHLFGISVSRLWREGREFESHHSDKQKRPVTK